MCTANSGSSGGNGGGSSKKKKATPKGGKPMAQQKAITKKNNDPFNYTYNKVTDAQRSNTNVLLGPVIKDKYRNEGISYNQAYWAAQRASGVSQADMAKEQASLGKKAYSGDKVESTNLSIPKKATTASGGSTGGAKQSTASGGPASASVQPNNLKNTLAYNRNKRSGGKKKLKNRNRALGHGFGGSGLNIIT